jgi:hypothetical protein
LISRTAKGDTITEKPVVKILVGASVRRDPVVLEAHLKTLQWQILPPDVELDIVHVDDFAPEQRDAGRVLLEAYGGTIIRGDSDDMAVVDFDDKNPRTHVWQQSAFERVAKNKQMLFDKAVADKYDYVWICDTDLLMDPRTLWSMYHVAATGQQVTAAVYWTRWQNDTTTPAGPQVWLRHPYALDGRGLDFHEFRGLLSDRQLVRVFGLGACMLVSVSALERTRYCPLLPELVAAGGMNAGEDRTFSTLCERNHIEMYADAWPDIFHVYHTTDYDQIPHYLQEFSIKQKYESLYANYGDYVSLQIMPCEDPHIPPQCIRGRVGQLKLLTELEEAVLSMRRGDRRLLSLYFPVDYPLQFTGPPEAAVPYRGTTKTVEVVMVDHKPWLRAPVLREEYVRTDGILRDRFSYTPEQLSQLGHSNRP